MSRTAARDKTCVVLLRGVMPTGRNKVPMAKLRDVLSDAGFRNVRTYIQTGNVLVDTALPARDVARQVRALIREEIGPDLVTVVRTAAQLRKVLAGNPFGRGYEPSRIFFISFEQRPSPQKAAELMREDFSPEEIVLDGITAYAYIPGPYVEGRLANNHLEKRLGVSSTTRNLNTMNKLLEMSAGA